ncbi:MAG: NAD-dependent epimerase/dehydratase family protein [Flavisolibacter sp.]
MKILVTGATGFIGHYVINELLKRGHEPIASSSNEEKAMQASWYSSVKYIPFDLTSFDPSIDYFTFFSRPHLMIHLAWEGLPNYTSSFHEEVNLPGHLAFLSNLVKNGLQDLSVTGTCFEYGMQEGCLSEDMPCFPANPYARAKDTLRKSLEQLREQHPFSLKWIRLFYMYGKGQNPNSLLSQLDKALARGEDQFNMSGGEQVRDFLPVEKVAEYIVRIALQKQVTGIINCASNEPITVKKFVENYLKSINQSIKLNLGFYPYPDYEPMRFWGDNSRLKVVLNNE